MSFEIETTDKSWKAIHAQGRCGGPRSVQIGDDVVISHVGCSIDGVSDEMIHSKGAHVYHKAGVTIFESKGTFKNGQILSQISRYSANTMRVTWDLNWPKGTAPKQAVELGSTQLPGKFKLLQLMDQQGVLKKYPLTDSTSLSLDFHPLVMLFTREDNLRIEVNTGFDLWRWNAGLGIPNPTPIRIDCTNESLTLHRTLCAPGNEENPPEGREYRFMALFAWSIPLPAPTDEASLHYLPFSTKEQGLDMRNFQEGQTFCIDCAQMPVIENAQRLRPDGSRTAFCLESSYALTTLKRAIRQLASRTPSGTLRLCNLTPGICLDGAHCTKKGERIHWDLDAIITFASWAQNCLGDGWRLEFPQPATSLPLPSLQGLGLTNHFEY